MSRVVFGFPGHDELAATIARKLGAKVGRLFLHRFPDGETYVRLDTPVEGQESVFVCTLNRPNAKVLPLLFAVAAAKDLGAARVGVVAPYLAYLRQDARFRRGEAVTSVTFARFICDVADWILTVDPHLHRYASLDVVYRIQTRTVHAAPLIAEWIAANIERPLLIGPDGESEQWVAEVAGGADAPYVVLEKTRRGDRNVEVSVPRIERFRERTPVLVDDIIASARTMIVAVGHLRGLGVPPPVCIGVHALFAEGAEEELRAAGAERVVTCNTVAHGTNLIDLNGAIAVAVSELIQ